jgi:Helix-turn-helix domain
MKRKRSKRSSPRQRLLADNTSPRPDVLVGSISAGGKLVGALKLPQAAVYLGGLSIPTMHRLVQRGLLTPSRGLRHMLFPVVELNRFLRDHMTE